ncbi:YqiA/YcfP family alpha/beta fold hydrolase [Pontibacter sp. BAB1700]|uniref:YqiA/YcfP family alpha/beta fold hydrolase n=1 Tax=Pontibacter sp. BAB1700 TaxID=1144253 RepID=UPI0008FBBD21|nr:YqiA/YcfP family alpha/beta fold hydrolase [Pontibacter sp. BAB1700]
MKHILYLHGYNGSLTTAKRAILERYGNVAAPAIAYDKPDYFKKLIDLANTADVIIGSSFGGHTAHLLSLLYDKPALLFNPAFVTKSPVPDLNGLAIPVYKSSHTFIVLGKQDHVILYNDNLEFVSGKLNVADVRIVKVDGLGHRIPEEVFEEQVVEFWEDCSVFPLTCKGIAYYISAKSTNIFSSGSSSCPLIQ